ncbi:MAG TPA: hypothetical protein VK324_17730 [Tepidisphaeraceae bacterium]|nr:hypothetical protein [Tepidisphaeraceae bacterium]
MPVIIPPLRRRRGRPRDGSDEAPPPPVLVAVEYQFMAWVRLTFDVAVDVAGFLPATVLVSDEDANVSMGGAGTVVVISPTVVQVPIQPIGGSAGPGTKLTVAAGNGIVAAAGGDGGGGVWAGATDLSLPFP